MPWWPLGAMLLAFVVGAVGAIAWANSQHADVQLGEQFGGTVSQVSADGTGFCLTEDGTGDRRCSTPMVPTGFSIPRVGEHVQVTVAQVRISENATDEVFIVIVPPHRTEDGGNAT
jgi:hypothetical protein